MSKKYDEYINKMKERAISSYPRAEVIAKFPERDPELEREIRDKEIIAYVEYAVKNEIDFTYGDIRSIIDNDETEKEYENETKKSIHR